MGREDFYIDDHAALYGLIAKLCEEALGEKGLDTCGRGVITMARERGLRCAKRCVADGLSLTLKNYLGYGEFFDSKGWGKADVYAHSPIYQTHIKRCGWYDTWEKYGFVRYGKIYCEYIDKNLVYGFNPQLRFAVDKVLANGDAYCGFKWLDCAFEDKGELEMILAKRMDNLPSRTKDFLYHSGHLLSAMQRTLYAEYGLITGDNIINNSLVEYAKLFSAEKANLIREEAKTNFMLV